MSNLSARDRCPTILRVQSVIKNIRTAAGSLSNRSDSDKSIQSHSSSDSGYQGSSPTRITRAPFSTYNNNKLRSRSTHNLITFGSTAAASERAPVRNAAAHAAATAGAVRCKRTCRCAAVTAGRTHRQNVRAAIHGRVIIQMSMMQAR